MLVAALRAAAFLVAAPLVAARLAAAQLVAALRAAPPLVAALLVATRQAAARLAASLAVALLAAAGQLAHGASTPQTPRRVGSRPRAQCTLGGLSRSRPRQRCALGGLPRTLGRSFATPTATLACCSPNHRKRCTATWGVFPRYHDPSAALYVSSRLE